MVLSPRWPVTDVPYEGKIIRSKPLRFEGGLLLQRHLVNAHKHDDNLSFW